MREYPWKVLNSTLSQGFYCGWRNYEHWTRCKVIICCFPPQKIHRMTFQFAQVCRWIWSSRADPRNSERSWEMLQVGVSQPFFSLGHGTHHLVLGGERGPNRSNMIYFGNFWHASIMSRTLVPILDFWVSLLKPKALLVAHFQQTIPQSVANGWTTPEPRLLWPGGGIVHSCIQWRPGSWMVVCLKMEKDCETQNKGGIPSGELT